MKSLKYWIIAIGVDIALMFFLTLWKINGNDNAGNLFMAITWLFITLRVISGLALNKTSFTVQRPTGFSTYNNVSEFVFFAVLSYFGLFATAAFLYLGFLMIESARNREPKTGS